MAKGLPHSFWIYAMHIWVDADGCPGEIKELLFRAAKRTRTKVTLVANQLDRWLSSGWDGGAQAAAARPWRFARYATLVSPHYRRACI
jgi:hypothetical protein